MRRSDRPRCPVCRKTLESWKELGILFSLDGDKVACSDCRIGAM